MPGNTGWTLDRAPLFVNEVESLKGDKYQYGAAGPDRFDCAGLVQYGLEKVGLKDVPRTSEGQWRWVTRINKGQLRPGDLIFSQWPGDNASPGHVQIYIGGGQVIQAPHPGGVVSTAPLSADTGHIVGYGRPPGLLEPGSQVVGQSAQESVQGSSLGSLIGEAGTLLHGISEILDFAFSLFDPGQGWRIAFGAASLASGYAAVKVYMASAGSLGGSSFPLAVGLAGVSVMSAFMALRSWPQLAAGPEKPGAYLAEILEGQPPPPGPKRVHETGEIEAGLAVFAIAWLSSKASDVLGRVVAGVSSLLVGLGLVAAA